LNELVYCVIVAFTMSERADHLHHDNAHAHSTALVQDFFGKASHHPVLSPPPQHRFGSLRLLAFPIAKIVFEREEICECDGPTVHKLSQRRLTADYLALRESDCSRRHNKVSSDWPLSDCSRRHSKVSSDWPLLHQGHATGSPDIKMAGYFPSSPRRALLILLTWALDGAWVVKSTTRPLYPQERDTVPIAQVDG